MQTINKNDLIPLLQNSELADQFEDEIVIPEKYVFKNFKKKIVYDVVIEDDNDFNLVMDQLRFHMVKELPFEIYDYVVKNRPDLSKFKDFFFEELTFLKKTEKYWLLKSCATKGYLNLMKYAHKNRCSLNTHSCDNAALNGHLDCLKYLHENGCSWDSIAIGNAMINGHLDCLKYAIENGCSYDKQRLINAAKKRGQQHIIEYLESI
jgi:hypothetical protein